VTLNLAVAEAAEIAKADAGAVSLAPVFLVQASLPARVAAPVMETAAS
jgi:hypothetical protein